jgi:hypothetical protein
VAALAAAVMVGGTTESLVREAQEESTVAEVGTLHETVTMQNEVTELAGPNLFPEPVHCR